MLLAYKETPVIITMDIKADVVESVAWKRLGSTGPGGTESEDLQGWLLNFGDYNKKIVLVWKLSWTGYPIESHHDPPTGTLCQASWFHWISYLAHIHVGVGEN